MKNRSIIIVLQIVVVFFIFLNSIIGDCFADEELFEVGSENAQINFGGDDTGVYYVITDPHGRRVGYDVVTKQYLEEFPADFAISLEVRDYTGKYNGEAILNLVPGTYKIEVIGVGLTTFSVGISISRKTPGERFANFVFDGVIDKNLTSKFQFTYTSDLSKPAGTATRIATSSSLKQDITLSHKVGWITNDGIMNSLLKKAEAAEASIAKGNKNATKNQLNAFINEVKAQTEKHISKEASKMLIEDAEYLINHL